MKELLLVGSGHSHTVALDLLRKRPLKDGRITIVSDVMRSLYSGMVPGYVAGYYTYDDCLIDLPRLCAKVGARFIHGEVLQLKPHLKQVGLKDGSTLSYDVLSLACGSRPPRSTIPGAETFTIPVKPLDRFLATWDALLIKAKETKSRLRVLIVGGGAGGVEVALAMKHRLKDKCAVMLVERSSNLLSDHARAVRKLATRALLKAGIELRLDTAVQAFQEGQGILASDERVFFDAAIVVTGAEAPAWVTNSGLATDPKGFVLVNDTLRSVSHDDVFATGDVATMVDEPRPKSGVYAVRQGLPLLENWRRVLSDQPLKPYHPQIRALNIIGTGDERAILSWGPFAGESRAYWKLKQTIDLRFMRRFKEASP